MLCVESVDYGDTLSCDKKTEEEKKDKMRIEKNKKYDSNGVVKGSPMPMMSMTSKSTCWCAAFKTDKVELVAFTHQLECIQTLRERVDIDRSGVAHMSIGRNQKWLIIKIKRTRNIDIPGLSLRQ